MKKKKTEKPKYHMGQNVWYMVKTAWEEKEKKVIFLSCLIALSAVALNLLQLFVVPSILSAVENRVSFAQLVTTILLFVAGLMFFSGLSAYLDLNVIFGRVTVRSALLYRISMKQIKTSYPNLNDDRFQNLGDKAKRSTMGNDEAAEAVWNTVTSLATNLIGFAVYVAMLGRIQPLLLGIILLTTITSYLISNRLNEYGYRHREEEAAYSKQMGYLSDCMKDVSGAKDIRIFGRPWLEALYQKTRDSYTAFHKKAQGIYLWGKVIDLVLTFLRNGVAYAFLIMLVLKGTLSTAEFLLYFGIVGGFSTWVTGILGSFGVLYKQSLELSTVREFLEYDEMFLFEKGEKLIFSTSAEYEIKLENVSFCYPGAAHNTLEGINLTLHPGEKLAVVGLNGAGKTTLVKLICGFLDPTVGRVLLNGKDIKRYNRADYYRMFSAVFQDFDLIAGTVATNIAQDDTKQDMEKIKDSLKKAGLSDKINGLPQKEQTHLCRDVYDDAVMLSGGETQRLMLARALYKNAPIIVLDEPTAALDTIAESDLYQKYAEMTKGKSSVYISHRLASTRFCDRIILIDSGKIAEAGTHEQLIALGGKYAELFAVQSQYYQEEGPEDEQE